MRGKRLLAAVAVAAATSGCAVTHTATPVAMGVEPDEICVVERPDVFAPVLVAMRESLGSRGMRVRLLPKDSATDACPLTATYVAKRTWDFKTYVAEAQIQVYRSGIKAGEATYVADSMALRKYESTESKVETMIAQLFPSLPRHTPFQERAQAS